MAANRIADAMLRVGQPPALSPKTPRAETTVEVRKDTASVEFQTPKQDAEEVEGEARDHLKEAGLDPAEWEVTSFRSSEWTMASGEPGRSARFGFARKGTEKVGVEVEDSLALIENWTPPEPVDRKGATPSHALLFLLGDFQLGKYENDTDLAVERALNYAHEAVEWYYDRFRDVSEIAIGFMGDHGEGVVSQNGANIWRTTLTPTQQVRLVQRLMRKIVKGFAQDVPADVPIRVVSVPGNHGDAVRINGKGVTKFDDNWDTEALTMVADSFEMATEFAKEDIRPLLERVSFYVPAEDEISVVLDLAGTRVAFAHGHFHQPGKAIQWLKGQAFDKSSQMRDADILVEGHLHHFHMDTDSGVTFIGVPAVESESTWFRHRTGITGDPGAVVALVRDGSLGAIEVIR